MFKRTAGAVLLAALVAAPAWAQDNPVAATVNGRDITAADVAFAVTSLAPALEQVPAEQRPTVVLDLLIDMELLAEAAEKEGLDSDPALARRLDYYRAQTLRDLYMEKIIAADITDEKVQARYAEEAAKIEPAKEVSARHILVEDEEKAKALIAELDGGADFAKLAEENSADPGSASRGGSLGFFGPGQMVPPFEEAAMALEPGEYTKAPVQSRFGYHIILVDEVRDRPVPTLEQVGEQIRQVMKREAFVAELERLKEGAAIEKMTPAQ
ncbi:MAG: peptidylprolyl isomerase [Acuticoccus sp.]